MGIRTTKEFSKKIKLNAHLAYGLRDDEMKYGLGYKVFLSKKPRTILSMNYKDDNELLGQSQNAFSADNGIAGLFRYGLLDNLTRVKEFKAGISREWFQGFSTKVSFYNRELSAQSNEFTPNAYQYNHLDPVTLDTFQSGIITTTEIRIHTKFAYKEKYFDRAFERSSLGTKSPIIQAQFTFGVKGILGSDYDYTKAVINISDRIDINPFGGMNFELEGGKVWGAMPYPLLELPGGNETFMFDAHAFNGMDYFEFANDVYVSASVLHRFHGFFLNKIPLIRKLKWRELVGAKVIVGDLNVAKHNNIMLLPAGLNASRPYAEANIGVENIFKILRIDAVWRLTDLDDNNRLVRIKASVQFLF
jgi:hypothetical protein